MQKFKSFLQKFYLVPLLTCVGFIALLTADSGPILGGGLLVFLLAGLGAMCLMFPGNPRLGTAVASWLFLVFLLLLELSTQVPWGFG